MKLLKEVWKIIKISFCQSKFRKEKCLSPVSSSGVENEINISKKSVCPKSVRAESIVISSGVDCHFERSRETIVSSSGVENQLKSIKNDSQCQNQDTYLYTS
jgi:hypothetical protein